MLADGKIRWEPYGKWTGTDYYTASATTCTISGKSLTTSSVIAAGVRSHLTFVRRSQAFTGTTSRGSSGAVQFSTGNALGSGKAGGIVLSTGSGDSLVGGNVLVSAGSTTATH